MARFAQKKVADVDQDLISDDYQYGESFADDDYAHVFPPGLDEDVVRQISQIKQEPAWMLKKRLAAYEIFKTKPLPNWGVDLTKFNFDKIRYYLSPMEDKVSSWQEVPAEVKETFEKLGIPEAEQKVLAGVETQLDSEVVYGSLKNVWAKYGVEFYSIEEGLKKHPDLFKEYFGK